jgi:hypothetical protein
MFCVRNGLEDKMMSVSVNGDPSRMMKAIMRSWNAAFFPGLLHAGENSIRIGYGGTRGFDLDKVEIGTRMRKGRIDHQTHMG